MRNIRLDLLNLLLAALALSACGADTPTTAGEPAGAAAGPGALSGALPACLGAPDVTDILGLDVQDFPSGSRATGDSEICAYQGTDAALGVFVTTSVSPADGSEEVFSEMSEAVRLFLGAGAEPEAIEVGEGGYAYGSASKSVAAAELGGRLYYAEVVSTASADIGDKQAGMVALVERLMSR